ncbi:hypothetical protein MMC24_004873 [Lignoscripta atroalba]|nr:hypothetical protein [Lignoscripta atroalba]
MSSASAARTNGTNGEAATTGISPKITLYTNHGCPFAHRVHITLKELNLLYEEVIIDLDRPREEWYLKINPVHTPLKPSVYNLLRYLPPSSKTRGLVPSIKFSNTILSNEIITESSIVSHFLADSFPSASPSFFPASHSSPTAPLVRARINFFVDTWFTKVHPLMMQCAMAQTDEEKVEKSNEMVSMVKKEVEPLLDDASPFFGGSERLTLAEALIAPFLLRIYASSTYDLLPKSLKSGFQSLPKFSKWADAAMGQESVQFVWNEERYISQMRVMKEKMKAGMKLRT